MHYKADKFSKNNKNTITSKSQKVSDDELGKGINNDLTTLDVVKLKEKYDCPSAVCDEKCDSDKDCAGSSDKCNKCCWWVGSGNICTKPLFGVGCISPKPSFFS